MAAHDGDTPLLQHATVAVDSASPLAQLRTHTVGNKSGVGVIFFRRFLLLLKVGFGSCTSKLAWQAWLVAALSVGMGWLSFQGTVVSGKTPSECTGYNTTMCTLSSDNHVVVGGVYTLCRPLAVQSGDRGWPAVQEADDYVCLYLYRSGCDQYALTQP